MQTNLLEMKKINALADITSHLAPVKHLATSKALAVWKTPCLPEINLYDSSVIKSVLC